MTTKIDTSDFRVPDGKTVLKKWPTLVKPVYKSTEAYSKLLNEHVEELSSLQCLHYASNRYALLLIFQAMDAAGQDGAIRHVMSGVNPQGCQVFSFKHPSATELDHDFLWRTTRNLPERGRIGILNRSYYEEVLVVRVHPELLRTEGLPDGLLDEKTVWRQRYRSIVDLENHLHRNGTRIIKFFLHLSKDEQRRRFLQRIDQPDKNWKLSLADVARSVAMSASEVSFAAHPTLKAAKTIRREMAYVRVSLDEMRGCGSGVARRASARGAARRGSRAPRLPVPRDRKCPGQRRGARGAEKWTPRIKARARSAPTQIRTSA
jgi:PPK2 family polyphosphate:nucleotide phosphotransferase